MSISILIIGCCHLAILYLNLVTRESLICLALAETTPGLVGVGVVFKQGTKDLRHGYFRLVSSRSAEVDWVLMAAWE